MIKVFLRDKNGIRNVIPQELTKQLDGDIQAEFSFSEDFMLYTFDDNHNIFIDTMRKSEALEQAMHDDGYAAKLNRINQLKQILSKYTEDFIQHYGWRIFDDWNDRTQKALEAHAELRNLEGKKEIQKREVY